MTARKIFFVAFSILGFLILMLTPRHALAHAPSELDLDYDFSTQTLTVSIEHWAVSPSVHYVERIEIMKNGNKMETVEYKDQPAKDKFTYSYKVPAEPGDVLAVRASCSVFGVKSAKLKVRKPKEEPPKKEEPKE